MKPIHIIILIVLVVTVGVVLSLVYDPETYADFDVAWDHPDREVQIIGVLDTAAPIHYAPQENTDMFSFFMFDSKGRREKVWYKGSKPQDFELSEKVVLTGQSADTVFMASSMLLKCPSKYNDDTPVDFGQQKFEAVN